MTELERYISNSKEQVGQLGGNFGTIDMFFLFSEDKLIIEKGFETQKTIYVIRGKIKSKSNRDTIRYIIEYFIFLKLIDLEFVKNFKNLSSIINWLLEGNILKIKHTKDYERLSDYIKSNQKELLNYYSENIKDSWGKEIFFRHLKASYEIEFNNIEKFRTHKGVWNALVKGVPTHFSGISGFFRAKISDIIDNPNISETLILNAQKIANNSTKKEYRKSSEAEKLRREFKRLLQIKVISNYSREINENKLLVGFPCLEGAHIIPVYYLLKSNRLEDISNPDNGMLIDPNLHKIIDMTNSYFKSGEIILDGKVMGDIDVDINRSAFMDEFNELRKNKII